MQDIFTKFTVSGYEERSLDGNLPIEQLKRLVWTTDTTESGAVAAKDKTLNPMDIVTHILTVTPK